jgi:threonine synthase
MRYYSTRNKNETAGFAAASLAGLAPDGGLYVPGDIPKLSREVKSSLGSMSFTDIAFETIRPWVEEDIPASTLLDIVNSSYPFSAPLVETGSKRVLELFHGPTAAFKDFGARFMARAFSYFRRGEDKLLKILVATSGDTGGAVADGFFGVEGISVTVLYPKGRVTPLQEKQIAGLKGNITALAVEGSFDDCQLLVKQAFCDDELKNRMVLSSANSINIARLVPQMIYYAAAAGQLPMALFSVPSGNYGNLTAGLYAFKMNAPIERFIAASNVNKTVPDYLESGEYQPRPPQTTLSNAMDVGDPSNFERMTAHFSHDEMRQLIFGYSVNDEETCSAISKVYSEHSYYLDPHSAVGWQAAEKYLSRFEEKAPVIVVSTAHPAKFAETVEPLTGPVPVPPSLENAMKREVAATIIPAELNALKDCL